MSAVGKQSLAIYSSASFTKGIHMRTFPALSLVLATLVAIGVHGSCSAAPLTRSPVGTPEQIAAETLALKLMQSPEVMQQRQENEKFLREEPAAAKPDGKRTLQRAADEMAYAVAVVVAGNRDPDHPAAIWTFTAPHTWYGKKIPGSGAGFDNPDNAYRVILVDGASKYDITLRPRGPLPKMFSLYLYDSIIGDSPKRNFDIALAGFRESELKPQADGSFRITMDGDPANGRDNHMQSPTDARSIIIRNMLDDWGQQMPLDIDIKRVSGPEFGKPAKVLNEHELAQRTAEILKGTASTIVGMTRKNFTRVSEPNTVSKPFTRGGGWGYSARGTFVLKDDEALLLTVNNPPGQYLGIQVTDLWLRSVEHVSANGSLNNHQAEPNKDGSYSYVISIRDPGVRNWLHTGGMHEGEFLFRWQDLPPGIADTTIRETKVVKLADLTALLPDMTKLTPQQRKAQLRDRGRQYARRYLPQRN